MYPPPPYQPRRRSPTPIIALVAAVYSLLFIVVLAILLSGGTDEKVTVTGSMTLTSGFDGGEQCTGTGGYNDITPGASVIIHDAAGKVIAAGQLGPGKGITVAGVVSTCRFKFRIPDVPASRFYGIAVGHRNTVQFTAAQVKAGDVALSLDTPTE